MPALDEIPQWPAWEFDLEIGDAKTILFDKYNTVPTAIQEPSAFYLDVVELSQVAKTREEFYSLLQERRDSRFREISGAIRDASHTIIAKPQCLPDDDDQWKAAARFFRYRSYDTIAHYFGAIVAAYTAEEDRQIAAGERPERPYRSEFMKRFRQRTSDLPSPPGELSHSPQNAAHNGTTKSRKPVKSRTITSTLSRGPDDSIVSIITTNPSPPIHPIQKTELRKRKSAKPRKVITGNTSPGIAKKYNLRSRRSSIRDI